MATIDTRTIEEIKAELADEIVEDESEIKD